MRNKESFARLLLLSLSLLGLLACSRQPPVDALQAASEALGRAEEAFADDCATAEFRAAERLLERAREASEEGDYDRALTLAQAAEEQAELARRTSQANWDDCQEYLQSLQEDLAQDPAGTRESYSLEHDYELVPVYFAFDSYSLDAGARQTLANHAVFFRENDFQIIIEGHCDHHGTDAYNLALGERRARAVKQHLVNMGLNESRMRIISYGEFRPASETDDRLNRRAEFRIR